MKRLHHVICCILSISVILSCGMLQRSVKETNDFESERLISTALQQQNHLEKQTEAESVTFYADSTNHQYQVQVWPKGDFSFSADKGFQGKANKVLITGNLKGSSKGAGKTKTGQKVTDQSRYNQQSKNEVKSAQSSVTKKRSPSAWWLLGAVLLLSAGILTYYKFKY